MLLNQLVVLVRPELYKSMFIYSEPTFYDVEFSMFHFFISNTNINQAQAWPMKVEQRMDLN